MKEESNSVHWLERWYKFNCNGDWEHYYGVSMISLDNPGWQITIDLKNTKWEKLKKDYQLFEVNENDW